MLHHHVRYCLQFHKGPQYSYNFHIFKFQINQAFTEVIAATITKLMRQKHFIL